jgi:hypothetical protein
MTIDESWMREIRTSSLTRGRDIARQARYAVFRHRRGNPETRSTETYPYRCTLSTLPGLMLERRVSFRYPDPPITTPLSQYGYQGRCPCLVSEGLRDAAAGRTRPRKETPPLIR